MVLHKVGYLVAVFKARGWAGNTQAIFLDDTVQDKQFISIPEYLETCAAQENLTE